jgi:hypothetical protein
MEAAQRRQQRDAQSPLGIGEVGFVYGVFHAPTEATLKMSRPIRQRMSIYSSLFFHSSASKPPASQQFSPKPIIYTHSKSRRVWTF